jgi:hypothetical protein
MFPNQADKKVATKNRSKGEAESAVILIKGGGGGLSLKPAARAVAVIAEAGSASARDAEENPRTTKEDKAGRPRRATAAAVATVRGHSSGMGNKGNA